MEILIAYICLKIFENASLSCIILSFYSIFFVQVSSEKCDNKKQREGALFGRGALNGENTVSVRWKVRQTQPQTSPLKP